MPEEATWTRIGESVTRLSLAVSLWDDLTGERPIGSPQVRVDDTAPDVRNASGNHLYFGLSDDATVTVEITTDGRYEPTTETVDLSNHEISEAITVDLVPTAQYSFPSWATLLRGRITDGDDNPIEGVTLAVDTLSRTTKTNAAGEYVYYFTNVATNAVTRGDKTVLELDGSDPTITATHPDGRSKSETPIVEVSSVTTTKFTFP